MKEKQISNGILILLIIGCILFLILSSCGVTYHAKDYPPEPIGPYHLNDPLTTQAYFIYGEAMQDDFEEDRGEVDTISFPPTFTEPIYLGLAQPTCDHFYVKSAIPINSALAEEDIIWSPCICIHCKDKTVCK